MAGPGQKRITKVGRWSTHHTLSLTSKELGDLTKNAPVGMTVELKDDTNMNVWKVNMDGPPGTPYTVRPQLLRFALGTLGHYG